MALYLLETYKERFSLFEHTNVSKVVLHGTGVVLDTGLHTISAEKISLCTNGFESFSIFSKEGLELNKKFPCTGV